MTYVHTILQQGYSELDVAEFDSDQTIVDLEAAIRQLGYQTDRIGTAKQLCTRLAAGERWDLVFNIAEGIGGCFRESQVPTCWKFMASTIPSPIRWSVQ